MQPDNELLRQYATAKSESAFAELIARHVNLVYSAALRQTGGDIHLAHDVAQSVFTDLARKAASLLDRESLSSWLYTSAHFAANKMVRTEIRRRQREEQFMREPVPDTPQEADWEKLRPLLDAAMHGLKESDREAILLRYFENRPYAEVGAKFGLNENAARLRVERALEKLRALLAKRAITTTSALAAAISTNAIQAAPANFVTTLTTASLTASGKTTSLTLLKIMTAAKLKFSLGALAIAGAATLFIAQHNSAKTANTENDQLRQHIKKLESDADAFSNRLTTASDAKSLSADQFAELLKLRGEVSSLRSQAAEAAKIIAQNAEKSQTSTDTNNLVMQENKLRKRTLDAAHSLADAAVWRYADRHNGRFPTNWDQVKEDYEISARLGLAPGTVMPDTEAEFTWATNEYEFTYQGSTKDLLALTNGYDMIVIREKQPWQRSDGAWMKSYGFADGHGQLIKEPPEGFAAWESQRMAPQPTNQ
jgi:RNA polymerase sigma factor (sigma-70 family)